MFFTVLDCPEFKGGILDIKKVKPSLKNAEVFCAPPKKDTKNKGGFKWKLPQKLI